MYKSVLILPLLFLLSASLFALHAETMYDDENYYITSGSVVLTIPYEELEPVIKDFGNYRTWALKGIDGKDPVSKRFIAILSDVVYIEKYHKFILLFDINLPWPFGSKGNNVYFDIYTNYSYTGLLQSVEFRITKPALLVPHASLSLKIYHYSDKTKFYFESKIKIAWFIDLFYTLKGFKKNFEVRILNIIRNLRKFLNKDVKKEKKEKGADNGKKFILEEIIKKSKPGGSE